MFKELGPPLEIVLSRRGCPGVRYGLVVSIFVSVVVTRGGGNDLCRTKHCFFEDSSSIFGRKVIVVARSPIKHGCVFCGTRPKYQL